MPSVATDGSDGRPSKTLWDHAGEMKKLQGRRDIHGVLQCMSNIKRDGLVPDTYCYNIVINLFGKLKQLEEVERWFNQMLSGGIDPDAKTFAVLMDAYGISKNLDHAEWCVTEMDRRNLALDINHFSILIGAFARVKDTSKAEDKLGELLARGLAPTSHTFGALIDMYAQLGQPEEAEVKLQQKLQDFNMALDKKDCCMMMNAHANAGNLEEAIRWQQRIKDTFGWESIQVYDYTVLFKACARARPKQLDSACELFREQVGAGIQPDHFNIQTLRSVGAKANAHVITALIDEMGIDAERLADEFEAAGQEYNFAQTEFNRKLWKLKESD